MSFNLDSSSKSSAEMHADNMEHRAKTAEQFAETAHGIIVQFREFFAEQGRVPIPTEAHAMINGFGVNSYPEWSALYDAANQSDVPRAIGDAIAEQAPQPFSS